MNKTMAFALLVGMLLGAPAISKAVEFTAKGTWQFGTILNQRNLIRTENGHNNNAKDDQFSTRHRIRLQLNAVASEALSGTVFFEIGHMWWGKASQGAALGGDGTIVKVRMAYLDWTVPHTNLKLRMGLHNVTMPNAAGGSSILENLDVAGMVGNYRFNDTISLSAFWLRPFNDNFAGTKDTSGTITDANYLDNMDLLGLSVPMWFDGLNVSPWLIYGMRGKNTFNGNGKIWNDGNLYSSLGAYPFGSRNTLPGMTANTSGKSYGSLFFAGLPLKVHTFDPFNIEFEFNYGFVEGMGKYDVKERGTTALRGGNQRGGWLAKALVEYKTDWGHPGIFGWYASGDDGDIKNGSERMPSLRPAGNFTSILGDDVHYVAGFNDQKLSYAGSWGVGAQVSDITFVKDLRHTVRVAYWGGTNSPSMVNYANRRTDWNCINDFEGYYMTTNDGLLEINFNHYYKIYENLTMALGLGYVVNLMDGDTWQNSNHSWLGPSYAKQDVWKAELSFAYRF